MSRDSQRSALYAAEQMVWNLFDRAGVVEIFSSTVTLPTERRFADVGGVKAYVDGLICSPYVTAQFGVVPPVVVRSRRGFSKAHYEPDRGVIAIPPTPSMLRELLVLHEFAHHLQPTDGHGPTYAGTLVRLAGIVMGPEVEFVFRSVFAQSAVAVE